MVDWHEPAAGTLDDREVEAALQRASAALGEIAGAKDETGLLRGDMRGNGRFQGNGIDRSVVE